MKYNILMTIRRIKLDKEDWTEVCKEVARRTEGMSGREIAHLALDWQMKTIVTEKGELTKELMMQRTKSAMDRKEQTVSIFSVYFFLRSQRPLLVE